MGFSFEWTVKLGDIFWFVGALIASASFIYGRGGKEAGDKMTLSALAKEFTEMKTEFKTFSETLSKIAQKYGTSVSAIAEANKLGSKNRVSAGRYLMIPGTSRSDREIAGLKLTAYRL